MVTRGVRVVVRAMFSTDWSALRWGAGVSASGPGVSHGIASQCHHFSGSAAETAEV